MWSGAPQALLQHLLTNNPSQMWHQWVRQSETQKDWTFSTHSICVFFSRLSAESVSVSVCHCVGEFLRQWRGRWRCSRTLTLNVIRPPGIQNSIAEPCWDVSSLKCYRVRQWGNHSAVCLFCSHREIPISLSFHFIKGFCNGTQRSKQE